MKISQIMAVLAVTACLCLSGCSKPFHFRILGTVGEQPEFCPLAGPFPSYLFKPCGDQFDSVTIYEVDSRGTNILKTWSIEGASNRADDYFLKTIIYGVTPTGWRESKPAMPLREHVYYSLNGEYYFRKSPEGRFVGMTPAEFFDKVAYPPAKT